MDPVIVRTDQILQTKLYRPLVPADAISRLHLLERLHTYLSRQVILVAAPAGYGKTTLVSQWIDTLSMPWAWLSLDTHDGDLNVFITYFLAAVGQQFPEIGDSTRDVLLSPHPVPSSTIADSLISDLEELPEPLLVVLDDFYLVEGSDLEVLFERLVRLMPPNLFLLLTCRARPRLPLVSLRLRQQLGELTEVDLRLTEAEAAQVLSTVAGRPVAAPTVNALELSTEGWITGLYLAGLSLRSRSDGDMLARLNSAGDALVVDYLVEEVLDEIPPAMYDFFRRTSILDRFNAELCDALLAVSPDDSARRPVPAEAMLERIEASNLFLIALDDEHRWFRYHHLFQEYWQRRYELELAAEERAALHRIASGWFESTGQIAAAIRHALATGDPVAGARIAEAHYLEAVNAEDWHRLANWLAMLPPSVMDRPGILIMQAWIEHFGWRTKGAADLARRAEVALGADDSTLDVRVVARIRAEAKVLDSQFRQFSGDPTALELAQAALDTLPDEAVFARSLGELFVALGMQQVGLVKEAIAYLAERLEISSTGPFSRTSRLMLALCGVHFHSGDLTALESAADVYLRLGEQAGNRLAIGWSTYILGVVAYERNDLTRAELLFGEIIPTRNSINGKTAAEAYMGLFFTLLNSGRLDEAEETLSRFRAHLVETRTLVLQPVADSLQARLGLARYYSQPGEPMAVNVYDPPQAIVPKIWFMEIPQATAARVLLADGSPRALVMARQLLEDVHEVVVRTHELRRLVEVNTLLAAVCAAQGDEPQALDHMLQAVVQGAAQGYVRSIVDAGPCIAPLLSALRDQGEFVAYIDRLLTALNDPTVVGGTALEILLTNREMEVLERLVLRQTNKEIAADLFLSPLTVKRHTQSLFRKLGASNRREAVVLARQKGLSI